MPYIKKSQRAHALVNPETAGELNFAFTMLCKTYLEKEPVTYQRLNDIVGALESCKIEFYRRKIVGYESVKMNENGDVWDTYGNYIVP